MYSYLSRETFPLRTSYDIHWGNKMLVAGSLLTFLLYKNCIWFYNISVEYCFYNFVRLDLSVKKRVIKTIYFLLWCTSIGRYIWDYRSAQISSFVFPHFALFTVLHKQIHRWYLKINNVCATASNYKLGKQNLRKKTSTRSSKFLWPNELCNLKSRATESKKNTVKLVMELLGNMLLLCLLLKLKSWQVGELRGHYTKRLHSSEPNR